MWNGSLSPCDRSADNIIPHFLPDLGGARHRCSGLLLVIPLFHQPDKCCSCRAGVAPPTEKYSFPSLIGHNVAGTHRYKDGSIHMAVPTAKLTHWPIWIRITMGKRQVENKSITMTNILMQYHKQKVFKDPQIKLTHTLLYYHRQHRVSLWSNIISCNSNLRSPFVSGLVSSNNWEKYLAY